ncbi:hypothetical protein [Frankia sp. Cr2]|uniref:hypothetical protein n=1 Tax=Frankia sp. Cr2 TaxID=3073932 RepID=UPI002AD31510|nr:hypothetical protein [Frankia sp. Cr2]
MEHDYSVEGFVNERFVNGHGTGKIDPKTGTSEMEVTFTSLPDGWDPRTIVLMCCDRALVMASREVGGATSIRRASGGWLSIGRHLHDGGRDSVMYDDAGQILARVRATSETDFRGTTRFDRSRIEAGVSHLRPGRNGIAEIPAFDGVMMQAGPRLVTVSTRFSATLEDGTAMYGRTFYPHYLPAQAAPVPYYQILRVESVTQELDGNRLYSRVVSSVLRSNSCRPPLVTATLRSPPSNRCSR